MPSFGNRSTKNLETCHPRLVEICYEAIGAFDFAVLCGHRNQADQDAAYPIYSKVKWPNSKHNSNPSLAVDLAPWPINWDDIERFYMLAGVMVTCAHRLGHTLDGGFNWRWDEGHFQLVLPSE